MFLTTWSGVMSQAQQWLPSEGINILPMLFRLHNIVSTGNPWSGLGMRDRA